MKIIKNNKVQKMVVGGVAYIPHNPYASVSAAANSGSSSGDSDDGPEKISGTMTDKIIDIVKENGLPSDVNLFLKQVDEFLTKSQNLSNAYLFGGNKDYSLSQALQIQSMANEVRYNHEIYKKASENIDKEDVGSSLAINTNGKLYVLNGKGKLETVSVNEFDREKHRALTCDELISLRANPKNLSLAMNSSILDDLKDTVGLKTIADYIRTTAVAFGTNKDPKYVHKDGESIQKGLNALIGDGPDGYYKVSREVKIEDIKKATNFIYHNLNDNMKHRLSAEAIKYGRKPDEYITAYIQASLSEYNQISNNLDYEAEASKDASKSKSGDSSAMVTDTMGEAYSTGQGFSPPKYTMFLSSKKDTPIYALVQNMGPAQTADGSKAFGNANVEDVLTNSAGLPLMGLDKSAITFGDMPVDWIDASKLVYDSSSEIQRVWLPYVNDNGKIRPNFKLLDEIDTLNKALTSKKKTMTDAQLEEVASKYGLVYDSESKMFIAPNTMPFISFGAVASNDTLSDDLENSDWLHMCTDSEDKKWKDLYNDLTEFRSFYADAKDREKTGRSKTTWWLGYKFFKGNVFIPITDPNLAGRTYNDNYYPKSTYTNTTQKMMAHQQQQYRETAADGSGLILSF